MKFFITDGSGSNSTWSPFLHLDTSTDIVVSERFGMTTDLVVLAYPEFLII